MGLTAFVFTFCLEQDLSQVYTLRLTAGSQLSLLCRIPSTSSHCPHTSLLEEANCFFVLESWHNLDFASLSFNMSQCRLEVRSRGVVRFPSEFDKDTAQVYWVLPPGGTIWFRFFLSLWSQQLLLSLPIAKQPLGLQNGEINVIWFLLHLLAGILLQRETLPQ